MDGFLPPLTWILLILTGNLLARPSLGDGIADGFPETDRFTPGVRRHNQHISMQVPCNFPPRLSSSGRREYRSMFLYVSIETCFMGL
jgi:hypothetical protein